MKRIGVSYCCLCKLNKELANHILIHFSLARIFVEPLVLSLWFAQEFAARSMKRADKSTMCLFCIICIRMRVDLLNSVQVLKSIFL